jgi:diaminopimelate decarboxylase
MSFSDLKKYKRVLVTGPQRSGTRIASKMIAHDTNLRFVREEEFSVHSVSLFELIVTREFTIVVQCPGMSHIIHKYSASDTMIVMMMRNVEDIVASEERIGWDHGYFRELLKLGISNSAAELRRARREGVRPSELKYENWETQKEVIQHYIEVDYESLSEHELWIPKEDRSDFKETQTI